MANLDQSPLQGEALGLAWWNTSLSPNAKPGRAAAPDHAHAVDVLKAMIASGVSVVGLAEIAVADVDELRKDPEIGAWLFTEAGRPVGKSRFDTCIAYDPARFTLSEEKEVIGRRGRRRLKVAQHFAFDLSGGVGALHVFVSHWPSRLHLHQAAPDRLVYAGVLRGAIDGILELDQSAQVVLMGDYNDEPFDNSMSYGLLASREREYAVKKPGLLYNPFWRHMASIVHGGACSPCSDKGTYYYAGGEIARWFMFDQMLFSQSLLGIGGVWDLDDSLTRVYAANGLVESVLRSKSIFDHLPVVAHLKRVK